VLERDAVPLDVARYPRQEGGGLLEVRLVPGPERSRRRLLAAARAREPAQCASVVPHPVRSPVPPRGGGGAGAGVVSHQRRRGVRATQRRGAPHLPGGADHLD